jgi:UDP-N-acetylglucosamine 2-epimerase (non-hydrolysing)
VGGGTHTQQTAEIMRRLEPVFEQFRPDTVLVAGDVNSTLAAALVAAKMRIAIAHVEAGLRSFDRRMPEEINRVVTDAVSDYLFTTEPSGKRNLLVEGVPKEKIFFVGNVMIDTLLRFREKAARTDVLERLGLKTDAYAVVRLHRRRTSTPRRSYRDCCECCRPWRAASRWSSRFILELGPDWTRPDCGPTT